MGRAKDTEPLAEVEERLPGSPVSLQNAVESSQLIVIVPGVDMGMPSAAGFESGHGQRYYHVRLKVVKSLQGVAPSEIFPVYMALNWIPMAKEKEPGKDTQYLLVLEKVPDKDTEYLFFLDAESNEAPRTVKVLRATDENIQATLKEMGPAK